MKTLSLVLFSVWLFIEAQTASGQKIAVITDKAQILNETVETGLSNRLHNDSIMLSSMIDTRRRCDYWFCVLSKEKNNLILTVTDCNDKTAGTRELGSMILQASDPEKELLLYYALSEIIRNPYKNVEIKRNTENIDVDSQATADDFSSVDPGQHKSRYFFAPSAYSLEKGDLYYNTIYFFIHDVQYGITDRFSMGMGTTIMGLPFYLTPKLTFPINDKSSIAAGDLLMLGTWGTNFSGNLLYTTYTRGGNFNNISFGGGYLHTSKNDITSKTNTLVLNLSGLLQVSGHIYFITENYFSTFKSNQTASYSYFNPVTYEYFYKNEEFSQHVTFLFGLSGFRFINKEKDVKSWQFGLAYLFTSFGSVPLKYKAANWYLENEEGSHFIAFPAVGFARKFGKKY